jgi:hypothetical protein
MLSKLISSVGGDDHPEDPHRPPSDAAVNPHYHPREDGLLRMLVDQTSEVLGIMRTLVYLSLAAYRSMRKS